MKSRIALLAVFGALMLNMLGATAQAQGPQPMHSDPYWQAQYWNNKYMSGDPALSVSETAIDHDWGAGSPGPGIDDNAFSARWSRYVDMPAGVYAFTAVADDGMRFFIDGVKVFDAWHDQPPTTYTFNQTLTAGHHLFVVEYYENADRAVAKLSWSPDLTAPVAHWDGEYFNDVDLTGTPVLYRDEPAIDFHWGDSSPAPGLVNADHFSARWVRNVEFAAGTYRFTMELDDGMRLWVNNHLLFDDWYDQGVHTHTIDFTVPEGSIPVKLEYYEHAGGAFAGLSWAPVTALTNWRGEYFNNTTLSGEPALVRDDAAVFFNWGAGSPAAGTINSDRFSARWTRSLDLAAGTYNFWVAVDDGVRLWVNNHLLIDQWRDQSVTAYGSEIYLPGGNVPVKMEYYENGGAAVAHLSWSRADEPLPGAAVIVDDGGPGFSTGGAASGWRIEYRGFGGHLSWTWNNDRIRTGYNWARWYPNLAAGRYEVFVHLPDASNLTANARYWVSHAGGFTLRNINQNGAAYRWASLGTYNFRGTSTDYVSLSDVTYEARLTKHVVFDAVKWESR
ncbi:MAG: hypothetical protein HZB53_11150 [Chloroflexi bacterium]|nr:hypothetical protein [Chloroflexota bacterium]